MQPVTTRTRRLLIAVAACLGATGTYGASVTYGPTPLLTSIPSLSEYMMLMLTVLVAALAYRALRRHRHGHPLASLMALTIACGGAGLSGKWALEAFAIGAASFDMSFAGGGTTPPYSAAAIEYSIVNSSGVTQYIYAISNSDQPGCSLTTPSAPPCGVGLGVANGRSCNIKFTGAGCAAVNQAPSFAKGADQTVLENSGAQVASNFITAISPGPASETGQTVTMTVTGNTNAGLFAVSPAFSGSGVTRNLSYTPATNVCGSATITATAQDNGGILNGGTDSSQQTFAINVTCNQSPSATNLSAAEAYTEQSPLNLINIVVGDVDSANVTARLTLSNAAFGSLTTASAGIVTSTYVAGTGVWTATGPIADVNTLLAGVTYVPTANFSGNFTIATNLTDGITSVSGSKAMTGVASGTTIITSTADISADDGLCTLREAVIASNANTPSGATPGECNGAHTLIAPAGTLTFAGSDLSFSSSIALQSAGPGPTTLKGTGSTGIAFTAGTISITNCAIDAGIFVVQSPASVALSATGGAASVILGGGLTNSGTITGAGDITVNAASMHNTKTGSFSAQGHMSLTATGNMTNEGALAGDTQLTISTPGSLVNAATSSGPLGTLRSTGGGISITAASFSNNSNVDALGNITIIAAILRNETPGGDTREWYRYSTGSDTKTSTNAYYSFPDNYEIQYWSKDWIQRQRYVGGTPAFKPHVISGSTLSLLNFDTGTNVGAVLSAPTLTLSGNGGASFTNSVLALNQQNWHQSWEIYTHWIALGPATYDDHIRRNDDGGIQQSVSEVSNIGAGLFATTLNAGGFSVVNQGAPLPPF